MAQITQDTPIGYIFSGKPKKLVWERIWAFSGGVFSAEGWPKKNLHTDTDFAQSLGLVTVGVSATQYLGHLAELMIDLFGISWFSHGIMSNVRFVKLVANGDILVSKAKLVDKQQEGSRVKCIFEVYVENQNCENVLAGTATGLIN